MRSSTRARLVLPAVVLLLVAAVGCQRPAPGEPPVQGAVPTVSGPVSGGKGLPFMAVNRQLLEENGYIEEEFFFEGKANSYEVEGTPGSDGKWNLKPLASAPYKSRMVVMRPKDASKFSGNVVTEWFNVSSGMDANPDMLWTIAETLRSGSAYVSVSAQKAGIEGAFAFPGISVGPLKSFDPERYGSLVHPGDQYSYDIFSQAAMALRSPKGVDPMGGMRPKVIIGDGQSQSAARLAAYVDGVHPVAKAYDGFLIHSRAATVTGFGTGGGFTTVAKIRDDIDVPVIQVQTESELGVGALGFLPARQPDSNNVRTWEVAGGAHVDKPLLDQGGVLEDQSITGGAQTVQDACGYVNDSEQIYVMRKAHAALFEWAATGKAAASAPPMETANNQLVRDEHGNVKGGLRTPAMDVPIAKISGTEASQGGDAAGVLDAFICGVFGATVPFDEATLQSLYPTHEDYVEKVTKATDAAIEAGFILPADKDEIVSEAQEADVP